jgi:hypothetical protein
LAVNWGSYWAETRDVHSAGSRAEPRDVSRADLMAALLANCLAVSRESMTADCWVASWVAQKVATRAVLWVVWKVAM